MQGWHRMLLGSGLAALVAFQSTEASAGRPVCDKVWDATVESLQEARRRLKSPEHRQLSGRIACGNAILLNLEAPSGCPGCSVEYVQLLRDYIVYLRRAAEWTASKNNWRAYYQAEIDARERLGEFLADADEAAPVQAYWSDNFEGLGDAMERLGAGQRYHDEALAASSTRILSDKAFKTWARAIRSCQVWDFAAGRDRDLPGLNKILLCADQCNAALNTIRRRVNDGRVTDKQRMTEILDGLLPAIGNCPVGAP